MLISSEAIGKRARLVTFAHPRDSGTKGSRRHSTRGNNASGRSQEPCHLFGLRVRQKPSTCLSQKKKEEERQKEEEEEEEKTLRHVGNNEHTY